MQIHGNFTGGNITVERQAEDVVYLQNQLRDSTEWFYWAFCVEGAQGREITFYLPKPARIGYWGPAISHDLATWRWSEQVDGDHFTYRFAADESKVYFAHSILYHPDRFLEFADKNGLTVRDLCTSRRGRTVPCVQIGTGKRQIILTARHHACESTGSYVLEGVLERLAADPIPDTTVFCVPFVDYDGVVDGDQGKARQPHDHNREYLANATPLYPETAAIRDYVAEHGCQFGFDFHAPWHTKGVNDTAFLVHNSVEKRDRLLRFSALLASHMTPDALQYKSENDYPPNTGWNMLPGASFAYNMMHRPECDIAVTLETAYFGTPENRVTAEGMVALGRCFAEALRAYIGE